MRNLRPKLLVLGLAAATAIFGGAASTRADEIPVNTMLSAKNIDQLKEKTFQGHKLADLLTSGQEVMIRKWGLNMKLVPTTPYPIDSTWKAANERNRRDKVTLSSDKTHLVNYVAGVPFPDIDPKEPEAGLKLAWNFTYGRMIWDILDLTEKNPFTYLLVDGKAGLEREQTWIYLGYQMVGQRRIGSVPVEGDGSIFDKSIIAAIEPQDIKGVGVFTLRYTDARINDTWAYVRAVRRIRRLSGGAWVDPIGGTDQLQDDFDGFRAHPSWYLNFKILGRRWELGAANYELPLMLTDKMKSATERFPQVDLANAPYWNPVTRWEPREVWVVEATPPDIHPYSKKVLNWEVDQYHPHNSEFYDKKGELWKMLLFNSGIWHDKDPFGQATPDPTRYIVQSGAGHVIDLQRQHATIWVTLPKFDTPGLTADNLTLNRLEALGR